MQSIINCHVIYLRYLKCVQTSCLSRWLHVDDVGVLFRWSIKLKGSGGVIIGLFCFSVVQLGLLRLRLLNIIFSYVLPLDFFITQNFRAMK